jgi:hypothetical protein
VPHDVSLHQYFCPTVEVRVERGVPVLNFVIVFAERYDEKQFRPSVRTLKR